MPQLVGGVDVGAEVVGQRRAGPASAPSPAAGRTGRGPARAGQLDQDAGRPPAAARAAAPGHGPSVDPDHGRSRCLSREPARSSTAARPPPGASPGSNDDRLDAVRQRPDRVRRPGAAAGPPPGGSSRRNGDRRGQRSLGPTTTTARTSSGSPSSALQQRPTVHVGGQLVAAEPAGLPTGRARSPPPRRTETPSAFSRGRRASARAWRSTRPARPRGRNPATMPQPANRRICRGSVSSTMPQRSAIPHSPSPWASIQPTGPAYRSRSRCSSSAMRRPGLLGRRAADRRARVQGRRQPQRGAFGSGHGGHVGGQVQDVRQLQHVRGVRHVHPGAVRAPARRPPRPPRTRAPPGPCWTGPGPPPSARSRVLSPLRRMVPASTREVARPFSRRSSISGVAPTRPSTR